MHASAQDLTSSLQGISGILITPFDADDRINETPLPRIISRAIDAGVHVLVANGNTSEFYSLTLDEAVRMVHYIGSTIDGRVPLVAGVGRNLTEARTLVKESVSAGAAALMVHQPSDPIVAPRGIVRYVQEIADVSDVPLVLYIRSSGIGMDVIDQLCAIPSVTGIKWACPNPVRLAEAIARCDRDISWACGLAERWAPPLYAVGARGFTSGLINIWPSASVGIYEALESGNYAEAMKLIERISSFEAIRAEEQGGTNVSVIKAGLRMIGEDCGPVRPPSAWPLAERQDRELSAMLAEWGLASSR